MIKLLSKFDCEKIHPSLATPTCGCCSCCCCCCIATALASSAITSRSFGRAAQANRQEQLGRPDTAEIVPAKSKLLAYAVGFLVLPISLVGASLLLFYLNNLSGGEINPWAFIMAPIAIYCLALYFLGKEFRVPSGKLYKIAGFSLVGMVVELFASVWLILTMEIPFSVVLMVEVIVALGIYQLYLKSEE